MRTAAQAGLLLVAVPQAEIGVWGELAPRSFFRTFPGAGHHWLLTLGPYNEHLVRDYAAAELGLAALLVLAAVVFTRSLVLAAGATFLLATLPHLAFHLTTTDHLSSTDNVLSLGGFVIEIAVVATAIVVAARRPSSPTKESCDVTPPPRPAARA